MRKDGFVICTIDYYLDEDCHWVDRKTEKNPYVFSSREVLNLMTRAWDENWRLKPSHFKKAARINGKTTLLNQSLPINEF